MIMAPEIDLSDRSSSKSLSIYNLFIKKKKGDNHMDGIKAANFTPMAASASLVPPALSFYGPRYLAKPLIS